jgi:hypothetical protein
MKKAPKGTSTHFPDIVTPCLQCNTPISVTQALQEDFADNYTETDSKGRIIVEFLSLPLQCPQCSHAGTTLCIASDDFYISESSTANPVNAVQQDTQQAQQRHEKPKPAD